MWRTFRRGMMMILVHSLLVGCDGTGGRTEDAGQLPSLADVPAASWARLAEKRVFFGHQSVGYNIVAGIEDVMREHPEIRLRVVESDEAGALETPGFVHAAIGKNGDPLSKIRAFAQAVDAGAARDADVALFKFCYVDIEEDTDVPALFEAYRKAHEALRSRHPDKTFVHVTVPLKTYREGLATRVKGMIKRVLGRRDVFAERNRRRTRFNRMLVDAYGGREPIFDLARVESTFPDGSRCSFTRQGERIYAMVPAYTYDSGHLNELGRRRAAEQLLIVLQDAVGGP